MKIESRPPYIPPMHRIIFVGALVMAACQQPASEPSSTAADHQHIVATVDSLTRAFEQAERDRQPGRVLSFLSPDFYMYADGVRANYGEVVTGIHEISTFQHFEPGWENLEVRALGPDAALASFTFRDSIVTGSGDVLLAGGATTLIWERRDGGWRVVYADADHYPVASD
ncbi:MAG: nuclear transport factor 2 family protein [Gemmatimonadetes bacterium]|nr:nuclear transport factor 2 family protein [Gemmatimonadota bacterium]